WAGTRERVPAQRHTARGTGPQTSVADALAALGVEHVDVALLGREEDRLALLRGAAAVDARDERAGREVGAGLVVVLVLLGLLGGAVDVGVGAELLDHVDHDGDALTLGGEVEV